MIRTASATRAGSPQSTSPGFPVVMAQKRQDRVQVSPKIMIVAVPRLQHSPKFGQWALSLTVFKRFSFTRFRTFRYSGPPGIFALSQDGFRSMPKN
jgi:hypothetical protein